MKKKYFLFVSLTFLIFINSCSGYKPIFGSSGLELKIADYSINGNKKLGNQIYSRLHNSFAPNEKNNAARSISIMINVTKDKNATAKDTTGKVLEYKINLNIKMLIKDYLTNNIILDENFTSSLSFKVQGQHSETIKFENRTIENLMDKTYQDFLIRLTNNISKYDN